MSPFKNNIQFTKLSDDIYLIENFLNKAECDLYTFIADDTFKKDGYQEDLSGTLLSYRVPEFKILAEKIEEIIDPKYSIRKTAVINKMQLGFGMGEHKDSHDFIDIIEKSKLKDPLGEYDIKDNPVFGSVVYLNEFGGGEIYYPELNIEYKPNPGDLIIHSADILHGVKPVSRGYRYAYSNYLSIPIAIPKNL